MSGIHPRRQGDYQDPIKHASRPVNMTRKSTTRPVLSLSCFEFFLKRASHSNPPSTGDRLDNHSTSPRRPLNYLNTHLPLSSLLALRLVSHATKSRIDKSRPSPFTHLHLSLPPAPPPSLHALKHLSQSCTHLKITIINPQPTVDNDRPLNLREFIKKCLVLLSKLTTLHVSLPSPAITPLHHETLLSLRQALESSSNSIPHLTTLRLYPVTMRGLISFRSGAFTSFEDAAWVGGNFWQGISRLEMGLVGFMREGNEDGERLGGKGEGQYGGGDSRDWDDDEWAIREEKAKRKRDMVRMGLKILHDFLNSLAPELEVLSFEWLRPSSSPDVTNSAAALHQPNPNPLLLDLEVLRLFPPRGIPPANPPSTGSTSTGSGSSGPASAGSASTGITSPEGTSAKSTSTGATSPEATSPETTSADLGPGSAIAAPTPPENTATIARANTIPASATTAPDVPAPKNPVLATASITSATTATLPTSTNPPPPTPSPPANPAAPPSQPPRGPRTPRHPRHPSPPRNPPSHGFPRPRSSGRDCSASTSPAWTAGPTPARRRHSCGC
ncbi:MAG: hypothetical protein FRX48_09575 [Lasallia pustulata]|uniref:Uncharacterized protein n=1 Tax=Lasallia pustulata TaxID=136370 RepID=A0A5M8PC50_9LECA|nr:MAG: hypothetical protein FRX48_09575 [Lasallia pustulata]